MDDHPHGKSTTLVLGGIGKTGRRVVAQLQGGAKRPDSLGTEGSAS